MLLADDHDEFLAVAARLLEEVFEVVMTVGDARAAVEAAERLDPDLLVLDISMPGGGGFEAACRVRDKQLRGKVVFLTVHQDTDYLRAAWAAGARGYVVKNRLASDLCLALREVHAGRSFVSPSLLENLEGLDASDS